jgi:UDP-N-acetylglucosamine 4,6-dehydratase
LRIISPIVSNFIRMFIYSYSGGGMLNQKAILITGGTGSFGQRFARRILSEYDPKKIIIYSRDEYKQYLMRSTMESEFGKDLVKQKLRFFIGDVRDKDRLHRAFDSVDIVIHAAALKHVTVAEYNPIEAVRTNIDGAANIIDAAIDRGVERVVALSTDKAVNPVNLYGATKLVSDKLFVSGNSYSGSKRTNFSVVRYGNVTGSRGSVVPFFARLINEGVQELPITDMRMTRFWITLNQGVDLVFLALEKAKGGEIFVSKIPSYNVADLARAMAPNVTLKEVGIREGEKLHEIMVTPEDSKLTYDYGSHYIIYPHMEWWSKEKRFTPGGSLVKEGFSYASNTNDMWLDVDRMREMLKSIELVY